MSRLLVACALAAAFVLASFSTFASARGVEVVPVPSLEPSSAGAPLAPLGSTDVARVPAAPAGARIAEVVAAGKLTVAVANLERYPFFYTDASGKLVGSDIDLAKDIAHELGVEAVFNRTSGTFDGVVDLVAKGEADVGISKLSVTLPRAQKVRFTRPYIELAQGLVLNRVGLTATGQSHEKDVVPVLNEPAHRIGAVKGTSYVGFGHTIFDRAEMVEFPDKQAMFAAVLSGDVLGVLYDENEIKQYIFEKPDRLIEVKVQMLPKRTDPIAVAVADPQLQYWLDTYLELKGVSLSVNDLLKKYPRPESK